MDMKPTEAPKPAPSKDTPAPNPLDADALVSEHCAKRSLQAWQVAAITRRFALEMNARMTDADFDEAMQVALHGRV